jgi:hypothetical protein
MPLCRCFGLAGFRRYRPHSHSGCIDPDASDHLASLPFRTSPHPLPGDASLPMLRLPQAFVGTVLTLIPVALAPMHRRNWRLSLLNPFLLGSCVDASAPSGFRRYRSYSHPCCIGPNASEESAYLPPEPLPVGVSVSMLRLPQAFVGTVLTLIGANNASKESVSLPPEPLPVGISEPMLRLRSS